MMNPAYEDVPFDPFDLRPLASLNRRRFIALPAADPDWAGKTASELVSKRALVELVRARLAWPDWDALPPDEIPVRLNECLADPGSPWRAGAARIAAEHGRRLGCLIASLRLSRQGLSDPLLPWEADYLQYWREEVDQIFLGGGLASPPLGAAIAQAAQEALERCGLAGLRLIPAAFPSSLALVGAARTVLGEVRGAVLAADFGGSRAKRGIACFGADHALQRFTAFPALDIGHLTGPGKTAELAEAMVEVYADLARLAEDAIVPQIVCSVGSYVLDGQPTPIVRGTYTALNDYGPDVGGWFAERITRKTGLRARFTFLHDGDAAACALAGQPRSAVIMLGSALGVGFVPPAERCQPMDARIDKIIYE